jgi:hypothetical protein
MASGFNAQSEISGSDPESIKDMQLQFLVEDVASIPEKVRAGKLSALDAKRAFSDGLSKITQIIEPQRSMERTETAMLEGQNFNLSPYAGFLASVINHGVPAGQPRFTSESLAALELDLNRNAIRESMSGATPNPMPMPMRLSDRTSSGSNNPYWGMGMDSIIRFDQKTDAFQGAIWDTSTGADAYQVKAEGLGNEKILLYPPYSEKLGVLLGMDAHQYQENVYQGYVTRANDATAYLSKNTNMGYRGAHATDMYAESLRATTYFDKAVETLKALEPGLADNMYEKRVVAGLTSGQNPHDLVPQLMGALKTNIVTDLNDTVRQAASEFNGCGSALDFRNADRRANYFLEDIQKTIGNVGSMRSIPSAVPFEGALLDKIITRTRELDALDAKSNFNLSVRSLLHADAACRPIEGYENLAKPDPARAEPSPLITLVAPAQQVWRP